ncbi:galactokinase [Geojedonia litorea]|uniref:Galactokinase n=1 Tax=Geojedonia litorea TaxID=1268269 RepID=A0ABV9N7G0_9FLAO
MNFELIQNIKAAFQLNFNEQPIVVFAPGRINIIGEHTDYNEGFVLPAAIDKGIVAAISKSDTQTCTILALDLNESYQFHIDKVSAIPNGNWRNYIIGVVGEIKKRGLEIAPFNLVFGGDIPNGAGLSSSAALENSVVFGFNELFDLGLTKTEMTLISQQAEHNYVGVRCGIMDQYTSMFGVENHALLLDCRTQEATPVHIDFKSYELLLINTNVSHSLVDAAYNERRQVCEKVASLLQVQALRDATEADLHKIKENLSEADYQKALYIIQENNRVQKAAQLIRENNLEELGELLFAAHSGAQHQFKISCDELDFLVNKAKENPQIIGARMMGGGFGGCTINLIKKDALEQFTRDISRAYLEAFNHHCSFYFVKLSQGTHLI